MKLFKMHAFYELSNCSGTLKLQIKRRNKNDALMC